MVVSALRAPAAAGGGASAGCHNTTTTLSRVVSDKKNTARDFGNFRSLIQSQSGKRYPGTE
jgi:hypothetical protein